MTHSTKHGLALVVAALVAVGAGPAFAQQHDDRGAQQRDERGAPPHAQEHPAPHGPAAHPGEAHPGPNGYHRAEAPQGWNTRPKTFDRATYQHNFQAARSYKVGPYQRPSGWVNRHWGYGQRLPRAYWAPQYLLADYWLFGLEVPPVDYEWVRVGDDALLIDVASGEILQAEYGVFG